MIKKISICLLSNIKCKIYCIGLPPPLVLPLVGGGVSALAEDDC